LDIDDLALQRAVDAAIEEFGDPRAAGEPCR
jgi:hypothetical protein